MHIRYYANLREMHSGSVNETVCKDNYILKYEESSSALFACEYCPSISSHDNMKLHVNQGTCVENSVKLRSLLLKL